MLKKLIALAAAAALALSLSACGGAGVSAPPQLTPETTGSGDEAQVVYKTPDRTKYADSLMGLMSFMEDGKAVARSVQTGTVEQAIASGDTALVQTSYEAIGALDGYRYQFTFNRTTLQVEFYDFGSDEGARNEKAAEVLSSVQMTGKFQMLDNEVAAEISPNGRYLMIYIDPDAEKNEANAEQKEWAEKLFREFGKVAD